MRKFLLALILLLALPSAASAATGSWLDGLFTPAHRPVHHRAVPKPVAQPAAETAPAKPTPAPAPTVTEPATAAPTPAPAAPKAAPETPDVAPPVPEAAPVPMPRARPAAPTPQPSVTPATPAEASPAANATPAVPAGPQSTPATPSPAAAEGESGTPKPPRVYQTACPAVISGLVEAKPLPPIADGQCQLQSPLSVTALLVNGRTLPLSAPTTFGCEMATDLPGWVADVDNYLWSTQNTRIKSVQVGESYVCRPRNTPDGSSDLSEHGRADALDFVGFVLQDGRTVTVTADYRSTDPKQSQLMHFAHDAACTRFTTVLGPDANALHHDHFHLDLGCHGKTCTFRLCE